MSRPASRWQNGKCESFIKTLKREEIDARRYASFAELQQHLEEFIEQIYNQVRLHSALGYRSPEEFEQSQQPEVTWSPAALSFLGMRKSIPMFDVWITCGEADGPPRTLIGMSFRLGIPWQVALQQSLPPLSQPEPLCND
jgi:putative transposase